MNTTYKKRPDNPVSQYFAYFDKFDIVKYRSAEELQYIINNAANDFSASKAQELIQLANERLDYLNRAKTNPIVATSDPQGVDALKLVAPIDSLGERISAQLGDGYRVITQDNHGTNYYIQSVELGPDGHSNAHSRTYKTDGHLSYSKDNFIDESGNQVTQTYSETGGIDGGGFSSLHPWFSAQYKVEIKSPDGSKTTTTYNFRTGEKLERTSAPAKDGNGEPVTTFERSTISPEEQQALRAEFAQKQVGQALLDAKNFVPGQENVFNVVERVTNRTGVKLANMSQTPSGGFVEQFVDSDGRLVLTVFKKPFGNYSGGSISSAIEMRYNDKGFLASSTETNADGTVIEETYAGDREFPAKLSRVEKNLQGVVMNSETSSGWLHRISTSFR